MPALGKLVGRVPLASLEGGELVRLTYPPYDVVVALVDGVPHALEDACNHAGASLAEGWIGDGARIVCPVHGYVFSLVDGELVAPRGLCGPQRTFHARIEGNEVAVYDAFRLEILGP